MTNFPDDAEGQALQMIAETGSDFSKPMDVDIDIAAPDEEIAMQLANAMGALGFRTEVYFDDEIEDVEGASEQWTCQCSKVMLLSYEGILQVQEELNQLAKPLGGYVDGWSTFGNAD